MTARISPFGYSGLYEVRHPVAGYRLGFIYCHDGTWLSGVSIHKLLDGQGDRYDTREAAIDALVGTVIVTRDR